MGLKWISVVWLFSAVCGLYAYTPYRYVFVNESKNWTEAQSYCKQNYTDLATINTKDEMTDFINRTSKNYTKIWLQSKDFQEWQCSDSTTYREQVLYTNWENHEPNINEEKLCVQMDNDKKWKVKTCSNKQIFVCYEGRNSSYVLIEMSKSWYDAQSYCKAHHTGLASVRNQDENDKIKNLITSGKTVWIGLFRDSWQWSDHSNHTFQYWGEHQENNDDENKKCTAVCVNKEGKWEAKCSNKKFRFICYDRKNSTYILSNETKNWSDAQSHCRRHYTDLASVRNWTENQQIPKPDKDCAWIGLFKDWKWSDESNSSCLNQRSDLPDRTQNCTALSVTDQAQSVENCDTKLPSVCRQDKLILIQKNMTWPQALKYCRENHVDLVSDEIQWDGTDVAENASTEHVWLGLRYVCFLGSWFWVNGQPVCDYEDWAPGNGTGEEDCSMKRSGAMQTGGEQQWVGLPENQTLNFICTTYEG